MLYALPNNECVIKSWGAPLLLTLGHIIGWLAVVFSIMHGLYPNYPC